MNCHLRRFLSVETKKRSAVKNMLRRSSTSRYLWLNLLGDKISRGCPWMPQGSKSENWRFEKSSRNDELSRFGCKTQRPPKIYRWTPWRKPFWNWKFSQMAGSSGSILLDPFESHKRTWFQASNGRQLANHWCHRSGSLSHTKDSVGVPRH